MGKVLAFQPVEIVRHDSAPIALIYRNMGTSAAEEVVSRALAELALTLAALGGPVPSADPRDPIRGLRRIRRMAGQLGLVSLAQVAGDMATAFEQADAVAAAAVWARLMRVAEVSLAPDTAHLDLRP
jgi:hypothetical protein